ncbi:MAG TPA: hypothetical protein VFB12_30100, partial [Ktedonobacteraceae bacterium]|nr:hypothetical protein [Ktedonobacteraceae bacterium]
MQILVRVLAIASLITIVLGVTFFHAFATPKHTCIPSQQPGISNASLLSQADGVALLINEVLSNPGSQWNCSDPNKYAWIEMYNLQDRAFDLYQSHVTIDTGPGSPVSYFPFGASIASHGFFVLFTSSSTLHPRSASSRLRLIMPGGVDEIPIPQLGSDQSYARVPDGGNTWVTTSTPTIGSSNSTIQSTATETKREETATARADITPTETK